MPARPPAPLPAPLDPHNTSLDLVCLGRAGVDFYADQIGSRLEDVGSFSKYIGGSSTNIACCSSRMGLKTALITRVGDEHMGQFIREQLEREGVDTRMVTTDPARLTALVVLGIKDSDTFPLIFYRENCADMAIDKGDIDETIVTSAKALLITGTHFSTEHIYQTSCHALDIARSAGVKTALDIDYRPVLWGLTSRGDGETRFIADDQVTQHLQSILPKFDLIVGTEEEIHIAGGSTDSLQALRNIRALSNAVLVLKRGPMGATVFEGAIPDALDDGITVTGVTVDVLNVLGAGDAFVSGFLRGWLNNEGYEQALRYANACGALVVSRHGCTPAMPTKEELDYYLVNSHNIPRPDIDTELNYLHRVTTFKTINNRSYLNATDSGSKPPLFIHAFDHRSQLEDMAHDAGVTTDRIATLKQHLYSATQTVIGSENLHTSAGLLCDGKYGQDILNAATGQDLWIARPVEQPGSRPLEFEDGRSIGTLLKNIPLEHIIKCLLFYSTADADNTRLEQDKKIQALYDACCTSQHQLLLEIIPPKEDTLDVGDSVLRSIEHILSMQVRPDWWKLPAMDRQYAERIDKLITEQTPHCQGIVVLGQGASIEQLADSFKAFSGLANTRGFAVGRTIFGNAAQAWLADEIDDDALIATVAENYKKLISLWH
jgi:5-dehydro-2-deoxygluconokinase